jgi:NDP-hexose-3-ketoreductase
LRLFLQEEPGEVKAFARLGPSGADESFAGILQFPSGVLAHFDCGFHGLRANTYELRGTEGRIVVERAFTMEPQEETTIRLWRADRFEVLTIAPAHHFIRMFQDFGEALEGVNSPRFPAGDAVANARVLDRLRAAAGLGTVDSPVGSH